MVCMCCPTAAKKERLFDALDTMFQRLFVDRILPFDLDAAAAAASIAADGQRRGRPVDVRDTQIAGIAVSRRASIATRNIRHFADLGIEVIDPWTLET